MDNNYQKPRRLEVDELTSTYGKFHAEPFEKGYGTTIGLALRRVLYSLIAGSAVTAVRIEGVLHEFSIIPGVYEDVLNIILNIQNIPFKLNVDEQRIVKIEKKGKGEVLSSDIISDSDVEVLDENVHIAYLEEEAELNMEIVIRNGMGFKLAEQNYDEDLPIDFISVDSNFNPIEKVKYSIMQARVGKRTDFDNLIIEIWTNGGIAPEESIARAGKILRDHLSIFLNYKDTEPLIPEEENEVGYEMEKKMEFLEKSVESLGLSVRALKCLKRLNVEYLFELVEKTEHELLNSKNFGKKSLEEIIIKLEEFDLGLGQKLPEALRKQLHERYERSEEEKLEE